MQGKFRDAAGMRKSYHNSHHHFDANNAHSKGPEATQTCIHVNFRKDSQVS